LALRFPHAEEKRLPASVEVELGKLAREMESALRTQLNEEAELLDPILGSDSGAQTRVDPDWHKRADSLFRQATLKERTVSRLFAVTRLAGSEEPSETSADAEVAQLRSYLHDMIASIP
jgi:hypothetical protein